MREIVRRRKKRRGGPGGRGSEVVDGFFEEASVGASYTAKAIWSMIDNRSKRDNGEVEDSSTYA